MVNLDIIVFEKIIYIFVENKFIYVVFMWEVMVN